MPRQKKYVNLKTILFLPLIALILLGLGLLGGMIKGIPHRAETLFGPPSPALNSGQVFYRSLILTWGHDALTKPLDPTGKEVEFEIRPGDTPQEIIYHLQQAQLIENSRVFRSLLIYTGIDTRIQAGNYLLSPALSPYEIALQLQDSTPRETTLTILPGWRAEEIASKLAGVGLELSEESFLKEVHQRNLEGFLIPDAYRVNRGLSARELVSLIEDNFHRQLTPEIKQGFERQGLTLDEAVILASIVEKEAVLEEEKPLIASVFLNRLGAGMALEADPTVQYALGYIENQKSWWKNPLTGPDLNTPSPYNTYLNPGLPPGPISNPALSTLKATAFPAQTNYYFFRAGCDGSGSHSFAVTYQEHLDNACP